MISLGRVLAKFYYLAQQELIMNNILSYLIIIFTIFSLELVQADEIENLIKKSQVSLFEGFYQKANLQLKDANNLAIKRGNSYQLMLIQGLLGNVALQQKQFDQSEILLIDVLQKIDGTSWSELEATISLYLGKLYLKTYQLEQAEKYIQQAKKKSELAKKPFLTISSYIYLAKLSTYQSREQRAWRYLIEAQKILTVSTEQHGTEDLWLNLGYQAQQMMSTKKTEAQLMLVYNALNTAYEQARKKQRRKTEILALDYLGDLYEGSAKHKETLKLTMLAINLAQRESKPELLISLEWRLGRTYSHLNKLTEAISAYRRAVWHIEVTGKHISNNEDNEDIYSSFKKTVGPVYTGLVDLLLKQAKLVSLEEKYVLLEEAQGVVETFKRRELQDYFKSQCEPAINPIKLNKEFPKTAALYPILLPDRLEIIIYSEAGLQQFTSPISKKKVIHNAKYFASLLRNSDNEVQIARLSRLFYDWLIRPASKYLEQNKIDTLLYIPDGALRLIPLAALNEGNQYLIEKYAIATLPGMSLTASNTVSRSKKRLLIGLSKPGNVVTDLPTKVLVNLFKNLKTDQDTKKSRDLLHLFRSGNILSLKAEKKRELLQSSSIITILQELLSLPGVEREIIQLKSIQSTLLLNEKFSLKNFTNSIKHNSFKSIHIASHGFFGESANQSFIMAHDRVITMGMLEQIFSTGQFRKNPPELLTLSACKTAEGNDRSPLGISGVAIKAKVASVLGSLWSIDDEATVVFMNTFYSILDGSVQTKAKAVQKAQIKLMKTDKFKSPAIWSPYILVGNWI